VLTLGGGIRIKDFTLDLFTQVHVLLPRDVTMEGPMGPTKASLSGTALAAGLIFGVSF
jgi:hypothetical protein